MGKKHFLKLAGLFLAGFAMAGCQTNKPASSWQPKQPKLGPQQGPGVVQNQAPGQTGQVTQAGLTNQQGTTTANPNGLPTSGRTTSGLGGVQQPLEPQ